MSLEQRRLAEGLVGRRVRWVHDQRPTDGEGAMTVTGAEHGMVEVTGYTGLFAPQLFRVVTEERDAR
jgi:hypothetical protein